MGITVVCKGEEEAQNLLSRSGWSLNNFTIKVTKIDMTMSSDEICQFITDRVKDEERVQSFAPSMESPENAEAPQSVYGHLVAAVEKSFRSETPKSPTNNRGNGSNPHTPQRGRSPNRYQGGGGGKGRSQSFPRPQNRNYPPAQNAYPQQNYVPYPPYPQPLYPMPPMSYAQVVQNPPPPPPMQNAKGGKGKGQYGKGHMAGRGGGQQIVATPPTQGSSTNYMGGRNTPWAGNCGFCYNSQRAYTHDHRTCPHNPRNAGQGKVGGRGTPLPQAQSAVAPPTNV